MNLTLFWSLFALSTREQRYVWDFSALGARLAVDIPREEAKQTLEHFPSQGLHGLGHWILLLNHWLT